MEDHRAGAQAKEAAGISDPKPRVLPAAKIYPLPTVMSIAGWLGPPLQHQGGRSSRHPRQGGPMEGGREVAEQQEDLGSLRSEVTHVTPTRLSPSQV